MLSNQPVKCDGSFYLLNLSTCTVLIWKGKKRYIHVTHVASIDMCEFMVIYPFNMVIRVIHSSSRSGLVLEALEHFSLRRPIASCTGQLGISKGLRQKNIPKIADALQGIQWSSQFLMFPEMSCHYQRVLHESYSHMNDFMMWYPMVTGNGLSYGEGQGRFNTAVWPRYG